MNKFLAAFPLVKGLSIAVLTATALIFLLLIGYIYNSSSNAAIKSAEHALFNEAKLIYDQVAMFDSELEEEANRLIMLFQELYPQEMYVDASRKMQTGNYSVPSFYVDGEAVNNQTRQIDYFSRVAGNVAASFFVRNGNEFIRVASTLKKEDGSRSTGSALNSSHPGFKTLMSGDDYIGRAKLFGRDYIAAYHPIKNASGSIVAMIAVAFDFSEKLADFEQYLAGLEVGGARGYAFVMDIAPGNEQGNLIVHPTLKGKNLSNKEDADGNYPFKAMIENSEGYLNYNFDEKDGVHNKLLAYKRFEKWNWALGIIGYTDDAIADTIKIRNFIIIFSIIALGILALTIYFVISIALKPLRTAETEMSKIGAGDLRTDGTTGSLSNNSKNEIDHLLSGQHKMRGALRNLIQGLHQDISNMQDAAASLNNVVDKNHKIVDEQNNSAAMVASSMTEMLASIKDIAKRAAETSEDTSSALEAASSGRNLMDKSNRITQESATGMTEVTGVIEKLHEESLNIGNILDVIGGVAEQTNLLALNAAIEAARAGEQGRGFAVVADEVRNLAKTTQDSTLQIKSLIDGLQASAKTAVEKANQAGEINQRNVEYAAKVFETLDIITENTQSINDKITQIAGTAEQQNVVAQEIESNVLSLQNASERSSVSATETAETGSGIRQLSEGLDSKVSQFTI